MEQEAKAKTNLNQTTTVALGAPMVNKPALIGNWTYCIIPKADLQFIKQPNGQRSHRLQLQCLAIENIDLFYNITDMATLIYTDTVEDIYIGTSPMVAIHHQQLQYITNSCIHWDKYVN